MVDRAVDRDPTGPGIRHPNINRVIDSSVHACPFDQDGYRESHAGAYRPYATVRRIGRSAYDPCRTLSQCATNYAPSLTES